MALTSRWAKIEPIALSIELGLCQNEPKLCHILKAAHLTGSYELKEPARPQFQLDPGPLEKQPIDMSQLRVSSLVLS
ncbi:hypothetical protein VNO77_26865 [Canavalia gladiata]|uniref:Uncharacterized protein n=1 Tax=Canavalia gladiata TaxID=3824 RepID=A0AAN9KXU1_CANGL